MNNKRGLSDVITTIVIIGVALVVVGVVWYVINNVIETQTENVNQSSSELMMTCLDAGYWPVNDSNPSCGGSIKYLGGQKCCTIVPT